jgi:hypothetical protein
MAWTNLPGGKNNPELIAVDSQLETCSQHDRVRDPRAGSVLDFTRFGHDTDLMAERRKIRICLNTHRAGFGESKFWREAQRSKGEEQPENSPCIIGVFAVYNWG